MVAVAVVELLQVEAVAVEVVEAGVEEQSRLLVEEAEVVEHRH